MRMTVMFRFSTLFAVACLLPMSGCQRATPVGKLQGRVTFENEPITEAKVQIQSAKSGYADIAELDVSGNFRFAAPVPAGKYEVSVMPILEIPAAGTSTKTIANPLRPDIPMKYRSGGTSGVTLDLKAGDNTFDVKMIKDPNEAKEEKEPMEEKEEKDVSP